VRIRFENIRYTEKGTAEF